jgi:hypothetical protein
MAKRQHWTQTSNLAPDYGYYDWTKEDRNALYWCIQNKILVYADNQPHDGPWKINIKINGKISKSPKSYGKDEVLEKIFEFYRYYAKKYNTETEV